MTIYENMSGNISQAIFNNCNITMNFQGIINDPILSIYVSVFLLDGKVYLAKKKFFQASGNPIQL